MNHAQKRAEVFVTVAMLHTIHTQGNTLQMTL